MRSSWKLPFIQRNLSLNGIRSLRIKKVIPAKKKRPAKIKFSFKSFVCMRQYKIPNTLVGFKVKIYNGKRYNSLLVHKKMLGFKFGELSITKIMGRKIAERKLAKQKKKQLAKKKKNK